MDSVATLTPWSSRVPFLLLEAPDPTVFKPKLPKRQGINPKGIPKNLKNFSISTRYNKVSSVGRTIVVTH